MFPPPHPTPTFPYRILAKVGEGAMGEVYRAEDLELGRWVAIKVIKPSFLAALPQGEAQSAMQRFVQEARAAAALTHAGVTTVHRVGTEGGWPYIAMEWLEGRSLEKLLLERGRMGIEHAARLGLQVLGVLAAAHQAGIVHRDIKPGNLMIDREGRLKVADFGIARVQGSNLAHTQVGMVLGTPQYAAPEQLAGKPVDARADLYALGVVLYEAVTGRPPFTSESLYELIHQVQSQEPPAPSTLAPGISPGFEALLRRALAKQPEERFPGAQEFAIALQPFLARPATRPPAATTGQVVSAPTLRRVPAATVEGSTAHALVAGVLRQWPATPLGRKDSARLLERLLERPLHAPAFCGALEVKGLCLLVCDGVIHQGFDPATGRTGDEVIDALPREVDATLHAVPPGVDPRLVPLLAGLLVPPSPRLAGLDASFTDLAQLAGRLASEGFDGALRFASGPRLGFALFSRGERVLDLFGQGFAAPAGAARWEEWIAGSGTVASVEDRRPRFPSITFRQQLRELELTVVRPAVSATGSIRTDTLAEASRLELRPKDPGSRPGATETTLQALLDGDPAFAAARWLLADLAPQFEQFGRTPRWKALLEPLPLAREVRLHHGLPVAGGGTSTFDAATYGEDRVLHHVVARAAVGSKEEVERFVARVIAVKQARSRPEELGGALLFAPKFTEEALAAYLSALRSAGGRSIFSGLDAFSHREGFLRLGARSGLHLLLVEEDEGRRRPLVPG